MERRQGNDDKEDRTGLEMKREKEEINKEEVGRN